MHDAGPAVAGHPHDGGLDTGVEVPATAMLLHEGVESGKQAGHGRDSSTRREAGEHVGRLTTLR